MEEYERHIKECIDEGFSAFKLHAWGMQARTLDFAGTSAAGPATRRR